MACIIALIVFSIMGLFSATHRQLAREAFDCVFRRVTFRPCNTGFKEKIRGRIIGKLLKRSVALAKFSNKYFEVFAWIFFLLTVASTGYTIKGGYNFYRYGSCNGLNQGGFCAFDPTGKNNATSSVADGSCPIKQPTTKDLTLSAVDLELFQSKKADSKNDLVFVGCYSCDYTRKAYPVVKKLLEKENINYTFIHFSVKNENENFPLYVYAASKIDQEKYWRLNDLFFEASKEDLQSQEKIDKMVIKVGYDLQVIKDEAQKETTKQAVQKQIEEIRKTHIYGTPTVFINGRSIVGPKPYRVYKLMLR
ncbi:MAG: thioredoxin domain-containing protein [Patescibacteria group bacterium]|nr:thioredoxin domain-containing protein [Patescibacteria group bacterium]